MAIKTFTTNELKLLPSKSLVTLQTYFENRKGELGKSLRSLQKKYDNLIGITTIDNGDNTGAVATRLPTSLEGAVDKSKDLAGPMAAISTIVDQSQTVPIKNLDKLGVTGDIGQSFANVGGKLDDISSPILADSLAREQALQAQEAELLTKIAGIEKDVEDINGELAKINEVFDLRFDGVIEEPQYDISNLNNEQLSDFINSQILDLATALEPEEEEPVFDLEFGPPISKSGQFILSKDGLYYDSRSGGLPEVVGLIEQAKKWNFEYAPNLGGKGTFYTEKDLTQIADTIFDLDNLNESKELKAAYEADLVLQELQKDKVKVVYDISAQIDKEISQGQDPDGSIVSNLQQSTLATIASFNTKEKKRKKQVEAALFFGVFSFRKGKFYEGEEEINYVPINDFSYLRSVGAAPSLEKQKRLVLETGDVTQNILPLTPKFVTTTTRSINEVTLSFGGLGDFVKIDGKKVDSVKPFVKTIGDGLESGILVGYNFLNPSSVDPSSTTKNMDNFAVGHSDLDGRLVASSPLDLYPSGLGIPYFYGLTGNVPDDPYGNAGKYSYGFLTHEKSAKVHDLFYKADGVTFDFWTHLPNLNSILGGKTSLTTSGHLYRLFFGCENSGESGQSEVSPEVLPLLQESRVLGYICGIRNKHSTDNSVSSITTSQYSDVEFVFAPTVGCNTDGNDGNTWDHSISIAEDRGGNQLAFTYDLSANVNFNSISDNFVHLALKFDFLESKMELFVDGTAVCTSGISEVFGTDRPKFPTFYTLSGEDTSSIHYVSGEGPILDGQFLTPITIGGGYSDMSPSGFLGANLDTSGADSNDPQHAMWSNRGSKQRSGLDGFLGSFKIYDKALSTTAVKKNYDAQKAFFKSIDLKRA